MLHHIKTANLGRVGDTVDVFVLYVRKDNQTTYMMAPHDIELITHITNVMPAMVNNVLSPYLRNIYNNTILFYRSWQSIARKQNIIYQEWKNCVWRCTMGHGIEQHASILRNRIRHPKFYLLIMET